MSIFATHTNTGPRTVFPALPDVPLASAPEGLLYLDTDGSLFLVGEGEIIFLEV